MSSAANATIGKVNLRTGTEALAGSIAADATVDIAMREWIFWPMFHATHATQLSAMTGHSTDAVDPDAARLALRNNFNGVLQSWDVDSRGIDP